ncbi:MAG TPA: NTP transferase domain-containing protein [Phenylobacterium sp.]
MARGSQTGLGVVILTGGGSSRMGADKAALLWNGRRAVDRLADLARELDAVAAVTAGAGDYGLPTAAEDPPGGGPAAGLLTGAKRLRGLGCERVLVVATDAPTITVEDLRPLLETPAPGAAYAGLNLPLVAEIAALPPGDGQGWAMGRLIDAAALARIACPAGSAARLRGANTPEEREALLADDCAGKRGAE